VSIGMSKMKQLTGRLMCEENGAALIEYSILIGLIAAAVVTTMSGSWGDAVDGETANAITIAMIPNVIEVNVILFITFFSFIGESVCLPD